MAGFLGSLEYGWMKARNMMAAGHLGGGSASGRFRLAIAFFWRVLTRGNRSSIPRLHQPNFAIGC